jgi:hypothetical protein
MQISGFGFNISFVVKTVYTTSIAMPPKEIPRG